MTNYWQRMWWTGALCCQTSSSRHSNVGESYGSVCEPICEQIGRRKSSASEAAVTPPSSTDAFLFHQRVEEYRSILPSARFNMDGRRPGYPQKKKLNMGGGGGIGSSIRSPLVKRDQHSQVVIRGWLYKLEGALAMKQWKKRWFVLADFCLFYYKDSDEEKLLGSILLPSYKINPCISEDRISKKFAFKAEHHNMKTYYFASDSKESMSQWMNAMSLATIMQKDTTTCEVLAERGYGSPVLLDDEESGFSSYRPRRTPQHHHSSINHPSMMNSYHHPERHVRSHSVYPENVSRSREFENGYTTSDSKYRSPNDSLTPRRHPGQPLYANAPPKPRRLTGTYPHEQGASGTDYPLEYSDSQLSDYYPGNNSQYRANQSDRESLDYSSDWPPGMPYQDNYVYGSGYYPATEQQREPVTISRRNEVEAVNASHYHSTQPPRPHSADFLERQSAVDSYTPPVLNNNQVKPRQRPKSSLEQYDRRHYWEDDSPQLSDHGHNYSYEIGVNVVNRERDHWTGNVSSVRRPSDYPLRNLDDNRSPNSSSYGESPSSTLRRSQPNIPHGHQVPIPYDYGLPEIIPDHPKVTVEKEILKDNEPPGLTKWPTMHPTKHPGYPVDPKYFVPDQETPAVVIRRPHHDHHRVRPHSAEYKLGDPAYSQTNHPNYQQQEQMMSDRDQKKVQLREESMRRLLEWKQRMLQSPLSRKYSPRSQPSPRSSPSHSLTARSNVQAQLPLEASPATPTSPPARPPLPEEYRQKVLQDLENHEARLRMRENILPPDNETPYYAGYGPPALMKASDIENQPPYSKEKVILPPEPKKTPQMVAAIHPTKPSHSIAPIHVVAPLSDVNISIESNAEISFPKVEGKMETDKGHAKYHGQFRSQDPRKSSSINRMGQHPSYSSDDEEFEMKQRNRRTRRPSQASNLSKSKNLNPEELERPNQPPSPDYVNLNIIKRRPSSERVDQTEPYRLDRDLSKMSSQQFHYGSNDLNDNAEDENKDYYIRREDYYRASQLFYSKTKNVNREKDNVVRSPSSSKNDVELLCDAKNNSIDHSMYMEERSMGDGIESNLDENSSRRLEEYRYSEVGLPVSPPLRGREAKFDKNRIRSQSLPRHSSTHNIFYPKPDVCQLDCEINWPEDPNSHFKRSSSTDMIDNSELTYAEFHRQTSLRNVSDCERNTSTLKHNYSFEEMRTLLAKQREAPPANIVSQRIKHFESSVETLDETIKKSSPPAIGIGELLTKGTSAAESYMEDRKEKANKAEIECAYKLSFDSIRSSPKEDWKSEPNEAILKPVNESPTLTIDKLNWQASFQRRQFCSDSDVGRSLCKKDSNSTTEESSIASAPIILSPLSSVLADLRRTADTKKEKKRGGPVDEVIITKGALRLSLAESKEINLDGKGSEECQANEEEEEEEEYLTMTKGKLPEDEAVYVAMDEDSAISGPKVEPVYNEPVIPPSSFLHDIFGKQKRPSYPGQRNSYSSSDESGNNVYEKPNWKNPKEKVYQNKLNEPEDNPVYEEPYSMTPYRPWDSNQNLSEETVTQEVEESIPDLLNHEESARKDTDASDADDEASRDFDTPHNNPNGLPSYQKEILMGEHSLTESDTQFDQSRALPLIPKYSTRVEKKPMKIETVVKESTSATIEPLIRKPMTSTDESGPSSLSNFREYKHFKVYEDERRCTEFVFKPAIEKGSTSSLSSTVNLKQVRIYKEGKEPGKLKFYSHSASHLPDNPNAESIRIKTKLSLDSQIETQHHLHIKPLHSYSDEASNSTTEVNNLTSPKHAKSLSYDSATTSQVSLATSYPTPDVVPFEPGENSTQRRNSSTSAPYYYSDLLPNGLQAPPPDQGVFHVSPRSSRALLNNVRDVSPNHARGDIGRKVNVIQENPVILNNASVTEESVSVSMARELRASLEQLLSPESKKFLDAERNKYEAGHTLEKTHHSSTLSKLKKRSATPDFDNHYRSNEPEYENLSPAARNSSGTTLTRRLSRSLEGLIDLGPSTVEDRPVADELDLATRNEPQEPQQLIEKEEPFYENIIFIRKEEKIRDSQQNIDRNIIPSTTFCQEFDKKPGILPIGPDKITQEPELKTISYVQETNNNLGGRTLVLNSLGDERDSDSEYLDENILRRESQRHFLAQGLGEKTVVGFTNKMKGISVSPKQAIISNPTSCNTRTTEEKLASVEPLPTQPRINNHTVRPSIERGNPEYFGYVSTDSSSDFSAQRDKTLGDSVVGTSSVSDEHMGRQRLRHISGLSKENLNSSDSELHKQTSSKVRRLIQRSQGLSREGKRLSISAGDLLEKSHEELVLLLIQLRRTLSRVAKTREKCHAQLESAQLINRTRLGCDKSLQNWEELKAQIQELEKQYDMTQPLVNLVENMVKLGSLYRGHEKRTLATSTAKLMSYAGQDQIYTPSQNLVEFSNNVVESEKPVKDNGTLNKEIYYLYELNRGYHAESANLMSLHQDKDMLEWTLDSVKGKVNSAGDNTMLVQKLKKQQLLLEKELNRVHNLLSHSTAKIEELTKENGKQEKEILLLKQKVQQALNNSSLDKMPLARANLESELGRVQSVIEELSHQRTEVANSIETLKQESQHCVTSRSSSLLGSPVRASPTGVAGSIPLPVRRKCQTTYFETDLDSLETRDLARVPSHIYFGRESDAPLYVNTDEMNDDKLGNGNESSVESPPEVEYYNKNVLMSLDSAEADRMLDDFYNSQSTDINEADDRMKRFYGILPREKPSEIKTVRIVKRESERRSRVRKKVSYDENHSLVWFEEPDTLLSEGEETDDGVFQDDPYPGVQNRPTTLFFPPQVQSSFPSAREQLFGGQTSICSPSSSSSEFRTPITPLFLLNKPHYPAATQTTTSTASSLDYRAPFKKAKRRHYTISGSQPSMEQNWIKNTGGLRSRDDMDMERCLRTTQINTPDIVRSTIKKVDVFDEKLIERELSLPQKIVIPERYIEVEPPEELSASEKLRRKLKAETIRKMLSETTTYEDIADEKGPTETLRKKLDEEKKKRAHLLALNHTIAKEVMERSKMVAATHTSPEPPPSTN